MPLNITTSAAASAGFYLAKNQSSLQKTLTRLASGKKIIAPYDDPGSLSVSMKLQASINRLGGAQNNIRNGISFLEVQDGIMSFAGRIVDRMSELKGLASQDPMKSSQDIASYNDEFRDLQVQLYQMSQQTFNGVSLFAQYNSEGGAGVFHAMPTTDSRSYDNTVSIYTSADGSSGPTISINKSLLLSALTVNTGSLNSSVYSTSGNSSVTGESSSGTVTFASEEIDTALNLTNISVGVLNQVLENIAGLRAQNGATQSRLTFATDNIVRQATNMEAAYGRIMDVDIAAESTRLAKFNVLKQASAAMLAQANSGADVALMLLR